MDAWVAAAGDIIASMTYGLDSLPLPDIAANARSILLLTRMTSCDIGVTPGCIPLAIMPVYVGSIAAAEYNNVIMTLRTEVLLRQRIS